MEHSTSYLLTVHFEGDTPLFGTQYSGGILDGTQYAKGRYAVRESLLISYADINSYFKKVQFSPKNTTRGAKKVNKSNFFTRSLRSRLFKKIISAFINLNIDLGRSKNRNSNKQKHKT